MKTTFEIPDAIFRRAKAEAARQGVSFRELVTQALAEKLDRRTPNARQPWMKAFGLLGDLHGETKKRNRIVRAEFERIEPEDWR